MDASSWLTGPLNSVAASGARLERAARSRVSREIERTVRFVADPVVDALIEPQLIDRVAARLLEAGVVEQVITEVLTSPDTEELVARMLQRPELERLILVTVDSPATDRIVRRVLASPGADRAITTVLESEEMQRIVEHIANSPEVRAAITQQSLGLADAVGDEVRDRSVSADDRLERFARRLLRRPQRDERRPAEE